MTDQKIENLLNLSLSATEEERRKSENLGVGYDPIEKMWEVIVRYSGNIQSIIEKFQNAVITPLLGNFAIIKIKEKQLNDLASLDQVIFIEKPKQLFFSIVDGKIASCINPVQAMPYDLKGNGVLAAVIDSGIDYAHPDFCNLDGTSRIVALWDQSIAGIPPEGYRMGALYTQEAINLALLKKRTDEQRAIVPVYDASGHGTEVAGIMAGNGRASHGVNKGVAPESELLVVKMGNADPNGFPRTTELMQGIDFCIREAMRRSQPVAINVSFGNSYGSHDGGSILESYIDVVSEMWKCSIVIAAGNDAGSSGHFSAEVSAGRALEVSLVVGSYEPSLNLQLWKYYGDNMDLEVIAPSGKSTGPIKTILGPQSVLLDDTKLLIYYGEPTPYNRNQEIYVDFIPEYQYVTEGFWTIRLLPGKIVNGNIEMWLPTAGALNKDTGFLTPSPELTITIPGTAAKGITVGAYDATLDAYADFSGRGFLDAFGRVKPDIVAPGVNITAPVPGGGYHIVTGTSFAAPFVSGSAVLLMQWGIVRHKDVYMYGEKLKAALLAGVRPLRGIGSYPDVRAGWGALCLADSIPR